NLIEKTREQGSYFQSKLEELKTRFPSQVSEIRGRGLMLAIAMQNDPSPAIKAMREEGLLVVAAAGRALRLLPPLTVSRKELDEALAIIERVLSQS
ncbi:MAG TPA: aspartate aminotransferase family protein, partial [Opitutae bacterium]|nr:aspartate aminotransferase family protein [Opitutae bacterium]